MKGIKAREGGGVKCIKNQNIITINLAKVDRVGGEERGDYSFALLVDKMP